MGMLVTGKVYQLFHDIFLLSAIFSSATFSCITTHASWYVANDAGFKFFGWWFFFELLMLWPVKILQILNCHLLSCLVIVGHILVVLLESFGIYCFWPGTVGLSIKVGSVHKCAAVNAWIFLSRLWAIFYGRKIFLIDICTYISFSSIFFCVAESCDFI